jgi:hypothetical protein
MSVIGLTFLPRGSVLSVITLQLLPRNARPKQFPDKVRAEPSVPTSSSI